MIMDTTSRQNLDPSLEPLGPSRRILMWIGGLIVLVFLAGFGLLAIGIFLVSSLALIIYDFERSPLFHIWMSILTVLIILGGYAFIMSFVYSIEILELSHSFPWVMMVSNYVFLVGSSVGLCLISSLGYVFRLKRYEMVAKRALFLALITMACGLASISLHLGHPERSLIYGALTPNFRSAMAYMGVLYTPYMLLLALWYWLLAREGLKEKAAQSEGLKTKAYQIMALEGLRPFLYEKFPFKKLESKIYRVLPLEKMGLSFGSDGFEIKWARIVSPFALIFALLAFTVEGSLFAHVEARPFWYGGIVTIDFLLGATFCGLSWLMAAGIITYKLQDEKMPPPLKDLFYEMAQILAVFLTVGFLFTAYKMGHGLFDPAKTETVMLFFKGPFDIAFWVFEITFGIILPIFILLYGAMFRKMGAILVGSLMVLIGYFVKRYDFVVAGQIFPNVPEGLPSYLPTFMEMLLIGGIIAALLMAYTLGVWILPLREGGSQTVTK